MHDRRAGHGRSLLPANRAEVQQDREQCPAVCFVLQKEIAEERARFHAELRLRCNGEKQNLVKVLKETIEEMNERLIEFAEVCNRLDLRFLEDQAVWNNYHAASVVIENCKPTSSARSKRSWTPNPQCT